MVRDFMVTSLVFHAILQQDFAINRRGLTNKDMGFMFWLSHLYDNLMGSR